MRQARILSTSGNSIGGTGLLNRGRESRAQKREFQGEETALVQGEKQNDRLRFFAGKEN